MPRASELDAKEGDWIWRDNDCNHAYRACVSPLSGALCVELRSTWTPLDRLAGDSWQLLTAQPVGEAVLAGSFDVDEHYLVREFNDVCPARYSPDRLTLVYLRRGGYIEYTRGEAYIDPRGRPPLPALPQSEPSLEERLDAIASEQPAEWARAVIHQVKSIPQIAALLDKENTK